MQSTLAYHRRLFRGTWGSAFRWILRAYARHAKNQRDYRTLLSVDDRILKDIGITRDMVRHEMRKPFFWFG